MEPDTGNTKSISGPWASIPRFRRRLWLLAAGALVAAAVAGWQLGAPDESPPTAREAFDAEAGAVEPDPAAPFAVPLRGGGEFVLQDHLAEDGGAVLLNLWASWCIPCRNEMPLLDDVAPLYPAIVFLGVAVNDSRGDAERFADEIGVSYPIGFDDDGNVVESYPAPAMPVTYVIDRDGRIRSRYFGELTTDVIDELLSGLS